MQTPAQRFALVGGAFYLAIGVLGFGVTGFSGFVENGDKAILGFDLNPFHNVVHIVAGSMLIAAGRNSDVRVAAGVSLGIGAILLVAAAGGFVDYMQLLSIDGAGAMDNLLHVITGSVAVGFGLFGMTVPETARSGSSVLGGVAARRQTTT